MKIHAQAIFMAIVISIPFAAYPQVIIEKHKPWVTPVNFDKDAIPGAGQESGFYYLLIDEQENTLHQESYVHYAYKILTNEGIQEMSDLSVEYDPS